MEYKTMFSLEGRVALVNGGASGHGAAIADGFSTFGAAVAVADRDEQLGGDVVGRIRAAGGSAAYFDVDLRDSRSVDHLVEAVVRGFGRIDILVNSEEAGIFRTGQCEDLSDEEWAEVMAYNGYGIFYICRAVGRAMIRQKSGSIINFSSTDAFLGVQDQVVYCATKGAVNQLTRVLAVDWIKHGIRVNAIAPCDFQTPLVEPFLQSSEYRGWITSALPVGRVGQTPEIVGAAVYLASDASSMVVGHTLLVDGGRTVI